MNKFLPCLSITFAITFAITFPSLFAHAEASPEKPLTANLIQRLYELNKTDQVLTAWQILAEQKDGYAISAAKIFGHSITVGKCVVEGNWKVVVGEEVRTRLYKSYAKLYQRSYIEFLDLNLRYPNTLEIEKLYQSADDAMGLPQSVSVDLLLNAVPGDWKKRVFFDRLSSLIGVGRLANDKRWYHYTQISEERIIEESIVANNVTTEEAMAIFEKTTAEVTKCMVKKLIPQHSESRHDEKIK